MREYQKPEIIDLKNSKAAGACGGGSAPAASCVEGGSAPGGASCNVGSSANLCETGYDATGCSNGQVIV